MSLDIQPKQAGDRITSADFNAIVSAVDKNEQDISGKVDKTQKIAGVDLQEDITKSEMQTALNVEDGAEVNDVVNVQQNDISVVDENKVAHIDAYKKEDALSIMCPQTDTTSTTITDAIEHDILNCKIYGNSIQDGTPTPANPIGVQSVGDLVTDTEDEHYGKYKIAFSFNNNSFDIYLDEPLRKVGDYADYIEYLGNGTAKVVRWIRKVPYFENGQLYKISSEAYGDNVSNASSLPRTISNAAWQFRYRVKLNDFASINNDIISIISDRFESHTAKYLGSNYEGGYRTAIYSEGSLRRIEFIIPFVNNIGITQETPLDDFITWLQNTDTTFYFAVATPTEETITLPQMLLTRDTNTIAFGTTVQPSSVNTKYYQDINKTIANLQALILNQ